MSELLVLFCVVLAGIFAAGAVEANIFKGGRGAAIVATASQRRWSSAIDGDVETIAAGRLKKRKSGRDQ